MTYSLRVVLQCAGDGSPPASPRASTTRSASPRAGSPAAITTADDGSVVSDADVAVDIPHGLATSVAVHANASPPQRAEFEDTFDIPLPEQPIGVPASFTSEAYAGLRRVLSDAARVKRLPRPSTAVTAFEDS